MRMANRNGREVLLWRQGCGGKADIISSLDQLKKKCIFGFPSAHLHALCRLFGLDGTLTKTTNLTQGRSGTHEVLSQCTDTQSSPLLHPQYKEKSKAPPPAKLPPSVSVAPSPTTTGSHLVKCSVQPWTVQTVQTAVDFKSSTTAVVWLAWDFECWPVADEM